MAEKLIDRTSAEYTSELIQSVEAQIGSSLLPGDERRIFVDALGYVLQGEDQVYNAAYANFFPQSAVGTFLDALGARVGVSRSTGEKAQVVLTCWKLDPTDSFTIPADVAFKVDGVDFVSIGSTVFAPGSTGTDLVLESVEKTDAGNGITSSSLITSADENWLKVAAFLVRYTQYGQKNQTNDDEAYRQSVVSAYNSPAPTATLLGWLRDVQRAKPSVVDIEAKANQGQITVYPLVLDADGLNAAPDAGFCSALSTYLNSSDYRPLGDTITVTPPIERQAVVSLEVSIPFASLAAANTNRDFYLMDLCRRLSGNALADYSEAVLIDRVLDIISEAVDVKITSDTTPGLNNELPKRAPHIQGEIFVYKPANFTVVFAGV